MFRKKLLVLIVSLFFVLISGQKVLAESCTQPRLGCVANPNGITGINCHGTKNANGLCIINDPDKDCDACSPPFQIPNPFGDVFGKIQPPPALQNFIGTDPTGAGGISKFLSNLVALIYSLAAIVLIFMFIWGAFDWMTSGGEKEKLESARNKIISAIIGIMLFAVAFAVIQVLGVFTGFTFFSRQATPQSPTNSQPGNSCNIKYSACLYPAGGTELKLPPEEQQKCQKAYQECSALYSP